MSGKVHGLDDILILLAGLTTDQEVKAHATASLMPSFDTWHVLTEHNWPGSQSDKGMQCALSL